MNEDDFKIVSAMEEYGGSFVQALAKAAFRADQVNLQKMKDTWPEYWKEYAEMAVKHSEIIPSNF